MRNNAGYFEKVMDPVADGAGRLTTTWDQEVPEFHPSTDPDRIAARHRRLVRATLAGLEPPYDPAAVSDLCDLPAWNVERALFALGLPFKSAPRPAAAPRARKLHSMPGSGAAVTRAAIDRRHDRTRRPKTGAATLGRVLSRVVAAFAASAGPATLGEIADAAHLDIRRVQQAVRNNKGSFRVTGRVYQERTDGVRYWVKTYVLSAKAKVTS